MKRWWEMLKTRGPPEQGKGLVRVLGAPWQPSQFQGPLLHSTATLLSQGWFLGHILLMPRAGHCWDPCQ